MMARVGFDGLMIAPNGKGHARSELHAAEALAARREHEVVAFVRERTEIAGVEVVPIGSRLTVDWELRGLPREARRHGLDVFVSLSERTPITGSLPVVVWLFESPVHRIRANRESGAPLRHRASDLITAAMWRRSLRRAAHVAFGSQATRDEVLAELELESTSVVYPGVPPGFGPGEAPERGEYVLHLGSNDPRDGTALAVEACRRAGARLLVAGGWSGRGAEALGRVSDGELRELYRGAAVYLDPTRYEGFGYGVLEAMACGAPVIASDVTSIPEVVDGAGILCAPESVDAFVDAIARVFVDSQLRAQLRARGLEQAARFTWEATGAGLSEAVAAALRRTARARAQPPRRR
jgi:glycosyltransferase involved in cell wall biosynthesis